MGRRKKGRSVSGILLLNKPQEMSSNAALQTVKRLYGAAKAGHTGALDPLATGMLPLCFGEATKFSQFLLDSDKGDRVIGKLGIRTDSGDSTGESIEQKPVDVSRKTLEKALENSNIILNRNILPGDEQKPGVISGIRMGTAAMVARGMGRAEADIVADLIDRVITHVTQSNVILGVKKEIVSLCQRFPVYQNPV